MLRPWSGPVLLVVACLSLAAFAGCAGSGGGGNGGDDDDDGMTPTPTPTATPEGVHLTTDTTWTGLVTVAESTTVDAGVTLTIASNATISFAGATRLNVAGTLVANGLASAPITMEAAVPTSKWQGVHALVGGSVTLEHVDIRNATTGFRANAGALESSLLYIDIDGTNQPLALDADTRICRLTLGAGVGGSNVNGGTVEITDSSFTNGSGGDNIIFGGSANITLDHVHLATQWHCLLHGGGPATSVTITNSQFEDAAYLLDVQSLTAAEVHNNTILLESGDQNLAATTGATTNQIDATGNYWGGDSFEDVTGQAAPTGWDVSSPLMSAPPGVGPRAGAGCEASF